jgi:hypothetical protein
MARFREQDLRVLNSGTRVSPIGPTTTTVFKTDGVWRKCTDEIGFYPSPTDLLLYESGTYVPVRTLTRVNGWEWHSCPLSYQPAIPDPHQKWPILTLLDRNDLAWKILSETNPSVPHVSIPTFVGELKDLPSLVKGYGSRLLKSKGLTKSVANGLLSWRWAIKPMIGDLRKLLRFQKAVNDRLTWLYKLRAGETLRRRVVLGTTLINDAPGNIFIDTTGCWIVGTSELRYARKAWGSAQWKLLPNSVLPQVGSEQLRQAAWELTLGLTSHEALAAAWELTPWSWLTDWFSNLGDVIAATNNSVGCTWQNVCYMRTLNARRVVKYNTTQSDADQLAALNGQEYYAMTVRKERYVVFPVLPVPVPRLPILTNGQWSILAALATQRL